MQSKDGNIWLTTEYIYNNIPTALMCPKLHNLHNGKLIIKTVNNSRNGRLPVASSSAFKRIKLMSASEVSAMPLLLWRR